jgi:hypothetical protein
VEEPTQSAVSESAQDPPQRRPEALLDICLADAEHLVDESSAGRHGFGANAQRRLASTAGLKRPAMVATEALGVFAVLFNPIRYRLQLDALRNDLLVPLCDP